MNKCDIDITGKRFGKITVKARSDNAVKSNKIAWTWECDCGAKGCSLVYDILNGKVVGCGKGYCAPNYKGDGRYVDGKCTPEYVAWIHMKSRCCSQRDPQYYMYGGRGINVCDRWMSFDAFLSDMGKRPSKEHSLDRINNSKGYSADNCRWATPIEQGRNTRLNKLIKYQGKTQPLSAWAEELGIKYGTLKTRLLRGWATERAFGRT